MSVPWQSVEKMLERWKRLGCEYRAHIDGQDVCVACVGAGALAQVAALRSRLAAAEAVCDEAISIAHGFDETCGKYPGLEKAIAAWRSTVPEEKG